MKYLKLFESVEELSHIEDLFADLKEIFDVKVVTDSHSVIVSFDIISGLSFDSTNKEDVAFDKLDKMKEYSDKLNKLQSEMKKVIKLCNCRYSFQLKIDGVYIQFYSRY